MKIPFFLLSLGLTAAAAFAQNNNVVRWLQINGVTTTPGAGLRRITTGAIRVTVHGNGN